MRVHITNLSESKCPTDFMLIRSNILEIFLTLALGGIVFVSEERLSAHSLIFQLLQWYVRFSLFCSITNSFKGAVCPPGRDS